MKTPGEDVVVRSVESALERGPSDSTVCLNCQAELGGPYCAQCGQR
ncbi:MAG: hypothetical protein VYE73_18480 [Acidobacteriota bacterium]|nr:hypothetical protein [Acidobacteriota bacterium]